MPAINISPLNSKAAKNRELKRLADTTEFSKAPSSRNVAASIHHRSDWESNTSKVAKRIKRERAASPTVTRPTILDSDRYYKHVVKEEVVEDKDAVTAEGFSSEWLKKMVVPSVKLNYRVRSSSGSEWRPMGKPTLKLVSEADKTDPQLHWCFDQIMRPNHLEEGCSTLGRGDCIIVKSGINEEPYIGMIQALWSDSSYGNEDLKVGLHWYYRAKDILKECPELESSDKFFFHEAAVYASKHYDSISAASIEDKCNVVTTNEYSIYRKRCKLIQSKLCTPNMVASDKDSDVLSLELKRDDGGCQVVDVEDVSSFSVREQPRPRKNGANVAKSNVYFCPGMWDVKSKKLSTQLTSSTDN